MSQFVLVTVNSTTEIFKGSFILRLLERDVVQGRVYSAYMGQGTKTPSTLSLKETPGNHPSHRRMGSIARGDSSTRSCESV